MTDEEICTLMDWHYKSADTGKDGLLERVRKVIYAEREACAALCERMKSETWRDAIVTKAHNTAASNCAAAIRARSNDLSHRDAQGSLRGSGGLTGSAANGTEKGAV